MAFFFLCLDGHAPAVVYQKLAAKGHQMDMTINKIFFLSLLLFVLISDSCINIRMV